VKFIPALIELLGKEAVETEPGGLAAYASDAKWTGRPPVAVALPKQTAQVQRLMRLCAEYRLPLIPRGAGTGTVGGAVAEGEALVLDLSRMNRLLGVDPDNLLADAEPGVVTGDFQKEMEKQGLFYPPDPASHEVSTLGGNAATNAGGLRAIKYGVTADWIAALEVVLADGQLIRTGTRTIKGVVGYDLTRLMIGSEGTLGIITGLTLRLLPKPAARRTLLALFATLPEAGGAVLAVRRGPIVPAAMELVDPPTLALIREKTGDSIPPDRALLLLETDGDEETAAREANALVDLLQKTAAREVRLARDRAEADELWRARRAISPALYELRPQKYADDVTVPVDRLVELLEGVARIAAELRLLHACYGHAGDGNVHANLLYDPADRAEAERARAGRERVLRLALDLGGTISGEHGVGIAKRPFVPWEQGPVLLDLQRRLKRAFDPLNLLNPGKVFP